MNNSIASLLSSIINKNYIYNNDNIREMTLRKIILSY